MRHTSDFKKNPKKSCIFSNSLRTLKADFSLCWFMVSAFLGLGLKIAFPPIALASNIGDASLGPGHAFFEVEYVSPYLIGLSEKAHTRKTAKPNPNITRIDPIHYCAWEGRSEQQVVKSNSAGAQLHCTPNRTLAMLITPAVAQRNVKASSNLASSANAPSFPGTGARSSGVWVKKVFQPVIGSMSAGKNYFGHGVVQLRLTSRDPGTNYTITRSFSINCSTQDWSFLDPDVAWFGDTQALFGRFSFSAIGKWACNRYGYKY